MATDLQMAGATAKGAMSGGMTGAQIGSMVPGVGTAVGAGVGAAVGGVGSFLKERNARQADKAVTSQDPAELRRLAEIDRIRKSIGAGTDPLTQQKVKEAQKTGAGTQEKIKRVTGGDIGATVAGLTKAQRGTQNATNQALAGAQTRLPFFENLAQQLKTRVSQRSLELGLMRRDQAMAERAQAGKEAAANLSGALGYMMNKQGMPGTGTTPSVTSPTSTVPSQAPQATSAYTEPNQVDIPVQSQMPIWNPSSESPVVAPGAQSSAAGNMAVNGFNPLNNTEILPTSGTFADVFGMSIPTQQPASGSNVSFWQGAADAAGAMNTAGQNIDNLYGGPM